jgi:Tc toxin complex TcA C-terminal TcB-binding domain/Neuraminidase-like domain
LFEFRQVEMNEPLMAITPVASGDSGDDVHNLHLVLKALELQVDQHEWDTRSYGAHTAEDVRGLLQRMDMPGDGQAINSSTADDINDYAHKQGILYRVRGAVFNADGTDASRLDVAVEDADNPDLVCAWSVTNADGRYTAWYDPSFYGTFRDGVQWPKDQANPMIEVLGVRSDPVLDPNVRPDVEIDLHLPEPAQYKVRGTVTNEHQEPALGITVTVYDRDIGDPRQSGDLLGKSDPTDQTGRFEITYTTAQFARAEADTTITPDLIFYLTSPLEKAAHDAPGEGGAELQFTITRLPLNPVPEADPITAELPVSADEQARGIVARRDELVRLTAKGVLGVPGPSEFGRLLTKLAPLTRRTPPTDWDEDRNHDVSFAAREVNEPVALIADFVAAHKLATAFLEPVTPAVLYALARTLGSRDTRSIAARTVKELSHALDAAIGQNTIRQPDSDSNTIATSLHDQAVGHVLQPTAGTNNFDAAVALVVNDPAVRTAIVEKATNTDIPVDEYWKQIKTDHPAVDVPKLQYTLHLATLTDTSVPLIKNLQQTLPTVSDVRQLAFQLDDKHLQQSIKDSAALPSTRLDGETDDQARARLAREVSGLFNATQPTSVIARLAVNWRRNGSTIVSAGTTSLIENAVTKTAFDITSTDIEDWVKHTNPSTIFHPDLNEEQRKEATAGLARLQRLFRVSDHPDQFSLLATRKSSTGAPYQGVFDIARYSSTAFAAQFADQPAEVRSAMVDLHERARSMADTVSALLIAANQDRYDTRPAAVTDPPAAPAPGNPAAPPAPAAPAPAAPPAPGGVPQQVADWTDMFGSVEQCECEDCRSLTGPAAYLVDLFEYLDKRCTADAGGITPLDILIGNPTKTLPGGAAPGIPGRRPDLALIKLTCENVNTTIPTIDLINEILESVVAFNQTVPQQNGKPAPNEPSPGVTGPELSAAPEHVIEAAYDKLSQAVYPLPLPYDRLLATARVHFAQAGVTRQQALTLFTPTDQRRLTAETLGLLARDYEILTGLTLSGTPPLNPPKGFELFGFTLPTPLPPDATWWTQPLAHVRETLNRLGTTYDDLATIVASGYVGGLVPSPDQPGVAGRLLLTVKQLADLRAANFVVAPGSDIAAALDAGNLTADDVKTFLAAHTNNPIVFEPPGSCDPDEMRLVHLDNTDVTATEWTRIHKFVRLARRMGIGFTDLDIAVAAVTATAVIDQNTLTLLAGLARLRADTDLSWPQAAALYGSISDELYDELFIRSGLARVHPAFRRDDNGAALPDTPAAPPITEGIAAMAAAFGASPPDLQRTITALGLDKLTLASVSQLYRVTLLAAYLAISAPDFTAYRQILGLPTDPEDLRTLLTRCRLLAAAGITPAHLALFTTGRAPADTVILPDDQAKSAFAELKTVVQTVTAQDTVEQAVQRYLSTTFHIDPPLLTGLFSSPNLTAPLVFLYTPEVLDDPTGIAYVQRLDRLGKLLAIGGLPADQFIGAVTQPSVSAVDTLVAVYNRKNSDVTKILEILDALALLIDLANQTGRPKLLAGAATELAGNDNAWRASAAGWLAVDPKVPVDAEVIDAAVKILDAAVLTHPIRALSLIRDIVRAARRLAGAPDKAAELLGETAKLLAEPIDSVALATLIKGVSAAYPADTWVNVSRQLSDPIREASRDALVAYLINRLDKVQTVDQLFDVLLIDPKINSFVLTSRIRQAIFAVQTFVQRALLGLEKVNGVAAEQINADEWQVISTYPLWSPRLLTFLYPENLLDPSWRDNKTPPFTDLESTLRQSDITPAIVDRVYEQFVTAVSEVGVLEISGTYLQTEFSGTDKGLYQSVLHVVGRSRGVPRKYFYRRLNRYQSYEEWTAWEAITVDIQGIEQDRPGARPESGDTPLPAAGVHVLPVVWRGDLHLFWPTFVRKVPQPDTPKEINTQNPVIKPSFSQPYWDIKLNWTRRSPAGWDPKQQSSALVETWWDSLFAVLSRPSQTFGPAAAIISTIFEPLPELPDLNTIVLKAAVSPTGELTILVCKRESSSFAEPNSEFAFPRAGNNVVAQSSSDAPEQTSDHVAIGAATLTPSFQGLGTSGAVKAIVSPNLKPDGDLLFTASTPVTITTLNQGFGLPTEAPLFFDLGDNTYYATCTAGFSTVWQATKATPSPKTDIGKVNIGLALAAGHDYLRVSSPEPNPWLAVPVARAGVFTGAALQSVLTRNNLATVAQAAAAPGGVVIRKDAVLEAQLRPIFGNLAAAGQVITVPSVNVTVSAFANPYVKDFVSILHNGGIEALLDPATQHEALDASQTFAARCAPNPDRVTAPAKEAVDFDLASPNGNYHWELFFFVGALTQKLLREHNQLDMALKIISYIYDPLLPVSNPLDAWRFQGLRDVNPLRLEDMLANLALPPGDPARKNVEAQIEIMRRYPFQPHRIARLRPIAYKMWVAAEAVALFTELGDRGLRRFTPESVNQSFQYYLLADAVLGPKPQTMRARVAMAPRSYAELRGKLDDLSNVLLTAETKLSGATAASAPGQAPLPTPAAAGIVHRAAIGYFGIPPNKKLLALWDTVADRLDKVRNGRNIDGVQIQLPLFSPPIDPALLAEAVAAGLPPGTLPAGMDATRPRQRYTAAYREALAAAQALAGACDALLATHTQRDSEHLARQNAAFETTMSNLVYTSRQNQLEAAKSEKQDVTAQREAHLSAWRHYRDLLGFTPADLQEPDGTDPDNPVLGTAKPRSNLVLAEASTLKFEDLQVIPDIGMFAAFATGDAGLAITAALVNEGAAGTTMATGKLLNEEVQELNQTFESVKLTFDAALLEDIASVLGLIPTFEGAVKPFGAGAAVHFGGQALATVARASANNKNTVAGMHRFLAQVYAKQGQMVLREREWVLGLNQASAAIRETDQRLRTADKRIAVAQAELNAQQAAADHAASVEAYLKDKFTNTELYDYRLSRQRDLLRRGSAVAFEYAYGAQACYNFERKPVTAKQFITAAPPTADDPKAELMVGHELLACLQEMNQSFLDTEPYGPNDREVVKIFSLAEWDPWALNDLRETGEASFTVPEVVFDFDHPGHVDRRIRSVQLTMPCLTGPMTGVTGTLTLKRASRRPVKNGPEVVDDVTVGTYAIALSTAESDGGRFELRLDSDCYLPFDWLGAHSTWTLTLPHPVRKFNYRDIVDCALTLRLVAIDAGDQAATDTMTKIKAAISALTSDSPNAPVGSTGPYRLISMAHDRPDEWAAYISGSGTTATVSTDILPFLLRDPRSDGLHATKLLDVRAIPLPKAAAAGSPLGPANVTGTSPTWTVTLPDQQAAGDPKNLDDILLLARFGFN